MEALKSITQFQGQSKSRFPHMREAGFFASAGQLVVCAWCGKVMLEVEGRLSHGCCGACRERYFKNGKDR